MAMTAAEFDFVCRLVYRESAIVLGPGKEYLVESRIAPLARSAGLPTVSAFLAGVQRGTDRLGAARIVDALTTNETSWFRDNEPFAALTNKVLPDLLAARAGQRVLRVWSAACSSGQEPYSLAMILLDALTPLGIRLEILATDLSDEMLARAKTGRFNQLEVNRGLPVAMLVKHFRRVGAEWEVSPEIKRVVTFRKLNLAAALPPMATFDVVFLRNVLIYFDIETKRSILRRVRSVMTPDGYLFLGAAETTLGVDNAWDRLLVGRTSVHRARAAESVGTIGRR